MWKRKMPVFLMFVFVMLFTMNAFAAYKVNYGKLNKNKFDNSYAKWNRTVSANQRITTPKVGDRADGTRCYWRANNLTGIGTNEIKSGETYVVKGNVNFYAVWNKLYTVTFYSQDGKTKYNNIQIKEANGEHVELPEGPYIAGKTFMGWAIKKNSKTPNYSAGKAFRMSGNKTYYAVYEKLNKANASKVVTLKYADGKTYKTFATNGKDKFPSVALPGSQTLMGWSTKSGKTNSPEYLEEAAIPNKAGTYYMVVNDFKKESAASAIKESSKYSYVYFVGDSRMEYSKNQFGSTLKKTKFIAKGGQGYAWFTQSGGGYAQLISMLKQNDPKKSMKKAIIFALGVNDLKNIDTYISFYKSHMNELKNYKCDLYIMSVNPFATAQRQYWRRKHGAPTYTEQRTQALRATFNSKLQSQLKGKYTYIDTYSWLVKNGWPTWDGNTNESDGIHYTVNTNKKIIGYVLKTIG